MYFRNTIYATVNLKLLTVKRGIFLKEEKLARRPSHRSDHRTGACQCNKKMSVFVTAARHDQERVPCSSSSPVLSALQLSLEREALHL
jgi:hypothetical protein